MEYAVWAHSFLLPGHRGEATGSFLCAHWDWQRDIKPPSLRLHYLPGRMHKHCWVPATCQLCSGLSARDSRRENAELLHSIACQLSSLMLNALQHCIYMAWFSLDVLATCNDSILFHLYRIFKLSFFWKVTSTGAKWCREKSTENAELTNTTPFFQSDALCTKLFGC